MDVEEVPLPSTTVMRAEREAGRREESLVAERT